MGLVATTRIFFPAVRGSTGSILAEISRPAALIGKSTHRAVLFWLELEADLTEKPDVLPCLILHLFPRKLCCQSSSLPQQAASTSLTYSSREGRLHILSTSEHS